MRKVRILSIDGGGIRGILPGVVLNRIEEKLQKQTNDPNIRLADMFDFMAGTSTGGILILVYLTPNVEGRPKFKAADALNFYLERGDEIFDASFWKKTIGKIWDEKYNASELEEALNDTFGELKLSNLLKPCVISSYDIRNGKPHFFKQHKTVDNLSYDFKVKDVGRATSAAPTYFETARIKNELGAPYILIDGGVFVNNPALVAYSEVRTIEFPHIDHLPTAKDMMIVSIGTGNVSKKYEYKKAKDWGLIDWVKPVIEIMMSGNSKTVHHHLDKIFDTLELKEDREGYYRIEPEILTADLEMDSASIKNLLKLKEDGLSHISRPDVDSTLDEIVEKLIRYGE